MASWLVTRLRALLQRRRVARELDEELTFHLERETELNVRRGLPPAAARRQAVAAFGGLLQTKEAVQGVRALPIEAIWQDVRHGLRAMRKRPGFTGLAVMTLALGIGVNAAAFAMAYGILVSKYRRRVSELLRSARFDDDNDRFEGGRGVRVPLRIGPRSGRSAVALTEPEEASGEVNVVGTIRHRSGDSGSH